MAKTKIEKVSNRDRMQYALAIYEGMVDGQSDGEIMDDLDLDVTTYALCKKFLVGMKAEEISSSTSAEVYGRYLISQEQNIKDLNELITGLNSKSQYNALVGAIRLRADITDKLITTGQTLGVIEKEPDTKIIIAGVNVSDMKDKDLRRGVVKAVNGMRKLLELYGAGEQKLSEFNVSNTKLHYGEAAALPEDTEAALDPPVLDKTKKPKGKAKAKSNKRSAGRRRVREK